MSAASQYIWSSSWVVATAIADVRNLRIGAAQRGAGTLKRECKGGGVDICGGVCLRGGTD